MPATVRAAVTTVEPTMNTPYRLRHHQHPQARRYQQEDARPEPGRALEEAVQARMVPRWLPQRHDLRGQPGDQRVRAARCPGEQETHHQVGGRELELSLIHI